MVLQLKMVIPKKNSIILSLFRCRNRSNSAWNAWDQVEWCQNVEKLALCLNCMNTRQSRLHYRDYHRVCDEICVCFHSLKSLSNLAALYLECVHYHLNWPEKGVVTVNIKFRSVLDFCFQFLVCRTKLFESGEQYLKPKQKYIHFYFKYFCKISLTLC